MYFESISFWFENLNNNKLQSVSGFGENLTWLDLLMVLGSIQF
jgi:bacteriocin-like protein